MISGSTFVRNNIEGAFCLFESMASYLPLVDEMIILDLGSTDGTLEILKSIAANNRKVRVFSGNFSCVDAKAFADAANQCVELWSHDTGIFWQADEIPHEDMIKRLMGMDLVAMKGLAFWRYQLRENFQKIKWFPHPVHRIATKKGTNFVGDGMNTDNVFGLDVFSLYGHDMGWFTKWGEEYKDTPVTLPTREMVLDVSLVGAFLDNIADRRLLHAPMWHEHPTIEGMDADEWMKREYQNPNWLKTTTPFTIPHIMEWHLGKTRYEARPELINALKRDNVLELLGV